MLSSYMACCMMCALLVLTDTSAPGYPGDSCAEGCKAIAEAFGADGLNIRQNNGDAAGQTVLHPHLLIMGCRDHRGGGIPLRLSRSVWAEAAALFLDCLLILAHSGPRPPCSLPASWTSCTFFPDKASPRSAAWSGRALTWQFSTRYTSRSWTPGFEAPLLKIFLVRAPTKALYTDLLDIHS